MSTTIAPGAAAGSGAASAGEAAPVASASRPGLARGSGLFHLAAVGLMPDRYRIIGSSRPGLTDDQS